jgi:hypothetical protein
VQGAWKEWNRLPESERKPGAMKVGPQGTVDTKMAPPTPPRDGLILKQYYRTLGRDTKGYLRHVNRQDFVTNITGMVDKQSPKEFIDLCISKKVFYEAQPDFVWLTEEEWKSLVPRDPKPGKSMPVATAISERIFRYHLIPTMAFGESTGWDKPNDVRDGKLTLTVEDVSDKKLRMRLDGSVRLGPEFATVAAKVREGKRVWGYEPRLLGYLEYDRKNQKFTRFDMVALGDTYGMLEENLRFYYRRGRQPLAASFQLVSADVPANTVPPRCAKHAELHERYFATGR